MSHTLLTEFSFYASPSNEASIIKGVPMFLRNHPAIKEVERNGGKVRYRGPRMTAGRTDWYNAQSYCLKKDAVTFAVYPYGR